MLQFLKFGWLKQFTFRPFLFAQQKPGTSKSHLIYKAVQPSICLLLTTRCRIADVGHFSPLFVASPRIVFGLKPLPSANIVHEIKGRVLNTYYRTFAYTWKWSVDVTRSPCEQVIRNIGNINENFPEFIILKVRVFYKNKSIILIYVDDVILVGPDDDEIDAIVKLMSVYRNVDGVHVTRLTRSDWFKLVRGKII